MTIKEILELRKAAFDKVHEIRAAMDAEKRTEIKPEEREAWDQANADFDKFDAELTEARRLADMDARMAATPPDTAVPGRQDTEGRATPEVNEETRALAFQGWANEQLRGETTEGQATAMELVGLRGSLRELEIPLNRSVPRTAAEARALSTTTTGGGYTIPEGFVNELEIALLAYGGMREVSSILRTTSGNNMPWPTSNDSGNKGAQIDESTADATDTDPAFGVVTFGAYKFTSKIVLVPYELLEDSAFNMVQFLGQALGERLGRIQNEVCTTGTGSDTVNGAATAATLGKTLAGATAITWDELLDLEHSVGRAYRNGPGAAYMFNDAILKYLRKIKDDEGRYVWQMGDVQRGIPTTLNGHRYVINDDMASAPVASAKTLMFGDFSKYKIREVNSIRLKRLVERYAEYDQEGFVALMRFDGDLVDAGTHPIRYATQATGS